MGKSNRWNIDWHKLGKIKNRESDRNEQVSGAAVAVADDKPKSLMGSVKAANIVYPQKPSSQNYSTSGQETGKPKLINQSNEVKEMETTSLLKNQHSDTAVAVEVANEPEQTKKSPAAASLRGSQKQTKLRSKGRDMRSGLELLDVDFMLSIVEQTDDNGSSAVTMRKILFNRLVNTGHRHEIDSNALKVYAVDEEGLYGQEIQCQAIEELADRTLQGR